jgi:hypothetical protein
MIRNYGGDLLGFLAFGAGFSAFSIRYGNLGITQSGFGFLVGMTLFRIPE